MATHVASGHGPENRVDDRVGNCVTIGVTGQTRGPGEFNTSENEWPGRIETVGIVSKSNAHDDSLRSLEKKGD